MARCRWFEEDFGSEVVFWFVAHVHDHSTSSSSASQFLINICTQTGQLSGQLNLAISGFVLLVFITVHPFLGPHEGATQHCVHWKHRTFWPSRLHRTTRAHFDHFNGVDSGVWISS